MLLPEKSGTTTLPSGTVPEYDFCVLAEGFAFDSMPANGSLDGSMCR